MMSSADDVAERALPLRKLTRLTPSDPRVNVDDEFLAKHMALRGFRGRDSRIPASALVAIVSKQVRSVALKQHLWTWAKRRRPRAC